MNLLVIFVIFAVYCVDLTFPRRWSEKRLQDNIKKTCRSGDGSSYRGFVSETALSRKCLKWNWFSNHWGLSKGLGNHNYCRNPDQSLMPWCHVRIGGKIVKEFCDIPRCSTATVKPPAAVDTELTCGERFENSVYKVVGGSFTSVESHPWIAAIFHKGRFLCGGSLIAPCWVVTAAHCFDDGDEIKIREISVYLGKKAINETDADKEQSFIVEKRIIHQKYEPNYNNDIALLKIKSRDGGCALRSASVRTVCLPPYHTKLPAGFQCSIAGFGNEKQGPWLHYSQYLKQAKVNVISQADCTQKSYYGDLITKNMFCAGSPDWSTDSCQGDSGGPLVCEVSGRMFLFGVVSWGDGCARRNKPGVYTTVTNYNKWIAAKTGHSKFTRGFMYPTK
ncbi:urokinase-type plasminogen activator-like [Antennarius striatus]|uniref:urokinase-type plasminogen activator-like n=1 Tax=Antennarius striatus TaxID=241820 RepID=UPI0035AE29F9